jgi:hypothetical protein
VGPKQLANRQGQYRPKSLAFTQHAVTYRLMKGRLVAVCSEVIGQGAVNEQFPLEQISFQVESAASHAGSIPTFLSEVAPFRSF